MISQELKIIYVHIPKTAGVSLCFFLQDYIPDFKKVDDNNFLMAPIGSGMNDKHRFLYQYNELYNIDINDYFVFTIIRNPYDRILSFFRWRYPNKKPDKISFEHFIKENYIPQYDYIKINDKLHVDKIVKFENLINDLKDIKIFKDIDFNDFPHVNKSIPLKQDYKIFFSENKDLSDLYYEQFKIDFEYFGYDRI